MFEFIHFKCHNILQCDSMTSLYSSVCARACACIFIFVARAPAPFVKSSEAFDSGRGQRSDPRGEAVLGQSRCTTSAAQSDRHNEAICNAILSLQPRLCYRWPSKLAAAGTRPTHQFTVLCVFRAPNK